MGPRRLRDAAGRAPAPVVVVVLTVVCCLALLAVPPVREALGAIFAGDVGELRRQADGLGAAAALLLIALVLLHIVVPFPAELPTAAAGFAFGFWVGLALMASAWLVSGLGAYGLARVVGRPVLERFARADRIAQAEQAVQRGGVRVLLVARLIPLVPFSFFSYACGLTRVPVGRFTWTTLVGFLPLTALTVLLGSRLQEPSLTDPLLIGVLCVLALAVVVSPAAIRRGRRTTR